MVSSHRKRKRKRVPLADQSTVPVKVSYLEWTEEQEREWIRQLACLTVDMFLDEEKKRRTEKSPE
jgi:hypothetical protein